MKLSELSTGPDWIIWIFVILLGILSIVLLSGHGSWLIAGYNTASKEEKAKYNGPRVWAFLKICCRQCSLIFQSELF